TADATSPSPARDAVALAADIRSGAQDAREVTDEAIRRIEELNPRLNAVVSTRFDEARAEVDAGLADGPLRGVPVLVKNLGADVDCAVVQRCTAAGLVVLGTTNVPELGRTTTTEPLPYGPCRNPWGTGCSTGGSSGGPGAAVASGMVPVAHGTDGGGSIRIPASPCGLGGRKPSRGRVPGWPRPDGLASPATYHHALTTSVRDSAPLPDAGAGRAPRGRIG